MKRVTQQKKPQELKFHMRFYLNFHSYTLKYFELWEASSDQLAIFNGLGLHLK